MVKDLKVMSICLCACVCVSFDMLSMDLILSCFSFVQSVYPYLIRNPFRQSLDPQSWNSNDL